VGGAPALAVPISVGDLEVRPMGRVLDPTVEAGQVIDVSSGEGPQRVVNGSNSLNNEFREVVALAILDRWGYGDTFCSGTLINHNWVVTAAHCVDGLDDYINQGFDLYVMWGTQPFGNHLTDYIEMERWIAHPGYNPNSANIESDIGLVELVHAKQSAEIMLVNDDPVNSNWVDLEMTFVGYGITGDDRSDGGTQRNTSMPIFGYDSEFVFAYNGTFDAWGYPEFNSTTNLCSGDSGGAGLVPHGGGWQLVGVNSYTVGDCEGGYAGDVRVDAFIPWIEQYTDVYLDEDDIPPDPDPPDDDPVQVDETFNPDDPLADDGGWGDPVRPTGRSLYGTGCSVGGLAGAGAWWVAVVAAARRRRR